MHNCFADHKKHVLSSKLCLKAQNMMDKKTKTLHGILGRGLCNKIGSTTYETLIITNGKVDCHTFKCPYPHCDSSMRYSHRFTHIVDKHGLSAMDYDNVKDESLNLKEILIRHYRKNMNDKN